VFVQQVQDGPSEGLLRPEDIIVALDEEPVGYSAELQAKIAQRRPGDVVTVTVYRNGAPVDVDVRLGEAPINNPPPTPTAATPTAAQRLGIEVEPLDAERAESYGFEEPGGVVLTDVAPGSAADRRQALRYQGYRIERINDEVINTPEDVREALNRLDSGDIASLHMRGSDGESRVLNIRMP
jgi:serine protease Do